VLTHAGTTDAPKPAKRFSVVERLRLWAGHADDASVPWLFTVPAAIALCGAMAALLWFGYVATREWAQSTRVVAEGRGREAAALVSAAIDRDMGGAASMLLVPVDWVAVQQRPRKVLLDVARTFASFPYAESVVIWTMRPDGVEAMTAFYRADRRPPWLSGAGTEDPFPVLEAANPEPLKPVLPRLRAQAVAPRPFTILNTEVAGVPYQFVAHLIYSPIAPFRLLGAIGFTVNLKWVREEYFGPLLDQVEQIGRYGASVSFAVSDERGKSIAATTQSAPDVPAVTRPFQLLFIDPDLLGRRRPEQLPTWTITVRSRDAPTGALADATRTFLLLSATAVASVLALLITVRSVQARAKVATMKSDFVSAVTHDLKTPVSVVSLVAETLAKGRFLSQEHVLKYAQMLSIEAGRLTQSIDHLLAYARYSDGRHHVVNNAAAVELGDVVDEAVEHFRVPLEEGGFSVDIDVPHGLVVHVDRAAIVLALDAVLDNAIKYSESRKTLKVAAVRQDHRAILSVADHGIGVSVEDLRHVFNRFYRGRNAVKTGSGLGLAIARRILRHHGGDVSITSAEGAGTTVSFALPLTGRV
jgi:signal transduction histidine kinase